MYREKWLNYYFSQKPIRLDDKWSRVRKIGKQVLSAQAQLRLEWVIFYQTVGKCNAKVTAGHFGISRKTFHKWLSRFDEKNLKSLEEKSRKPVKTRNWMVTKVEEERVINLRRKNMEYGKKKLKVIYQREYGQFISCWKIERVIKRHNLFPDKVKHKYQVEKRANSKPKIRIHQVKEAIANVRKFGFL
jgi:transposase